MCISWRNLNMWNRISEGNCSSWKKKSCWNREMVWEERISIEKPLCNYHITRTQPFCTTWWGDRGVDWEWRMKAVRLWKGEGNMQFLCFSLCFSQLESNVPGKKLFFSQVCLLVMVIAMEFPGCYLNPQDFSPYFCSLPNPPPAE